MPSGLLLPLLPLGGDLVPIAVVPVVATAGAALAPSMAAVVSVLSNPKALLRLCKEKPHIPIIAIAIIVGMVFLVKSLLPGGEKPTADTAAAGAGAASGDWAAVAKAILEQQASGGSGSLPPGVGMMMAAPGAGGAEAAARQQASEPAHQGHYQYRGDFRRNGYLGGPSPVGLEQAWRYKIDPKMWYLSSPLVVGDSVYGAHCLLFPPSNYGGIFRLDAATGNELWLIEEFEHPETGKLVEFRGFFSSPAISEDGSKLVIGQGLHLDGNVQLVCVDAELGEVAWVADTPLHVEGSPAIHDGMVIVGAGAIEDLETRQPKSHPGYVFAVDLETGKELWRHDVVDPESSPVVADGVAYIGSGFNGSELVALRIDRDLPSAEREVWRVPTAHPAVGVVSMYEDLVLIGCGNGDYVFAAPDPEGYAYAVERATGTVRWQKRFDDAVLGPIAINGDVAICPIRDGHVVAVHPGTGEELWRTRISERTAVLAGTAFTGTHVYAVTQDGYLVVLDAADGSELERTYVNDEGVPGEMGMCVSSPLVVDGRLYIGTETGGLRCYVGGAE